MRAESLFETAGDLFDDKKYQEALTKLFEALKLKSDFPKSRINARIAKCYEELNDYDNALKYADIALNDPKINDKALYVALYAKINIFSDLGRNQEALECIDRILKEVKDDPIHDNTLYAKAKLTDNLGYYEESLPWYQKALEAGYDPTAVYNGIATVYQTLNKIPKALENYDKGLEYNPNDILILCNKAKAYTSIGEYDKAIKCYTRISEVIATEGFASIENAGNATELINSAQQSLATEYQKLLLLKSGGGNIAELRVAIDSLKLRMGSVNEELADHKAILDDSGATDKALVKRGFIALEDKPELANYAKTFYWLVLNEILAYRVISTGKIQVNIDEAASNQDKALAFVAKKTVSYATDLCSSVPIVGGILKVFDSMVDDIFNNIIQNRTVNKGKAITELCKSKFLLEDDISIAIGKTAIALTQYREKEIKNLLSYRKNSDVALTKAFSVVMEKIDKWQKKLVNDPESDYGVGAKLALRDAALLIVYLCSNYKSVCNSPKPIDKLLESIVDSGGIDNMIITATSRLSSDDEAFEQKALSPVPSYEAHNDNSGRKAKSPVKNKVKSPDKGKKDKDDKCIVMKAEIAYDDPIIDGVMKGELPQWMLSLHLNTSTKNNIACDNAIVDSLTDNKSLDTKDVSSAILGLNEYSDNQQ